MIPWVNATLTAINAPGNAADYDTPATTGATRWTGSLGIYVAETLVQRQTGASVTEIVADRLELPYAVGALVQRGDRLTYIYETATKTRTARDLIHAVLVNRVRVILEDA